MLTDIDLSEYDDPRHYDLENPLGAEKTFFLDLVEGTGGPGLDVACGTGLLAGEMARCFGVEVTGIDLSAPMLSHARDMSGDLPVTYVQADCRDFDLPEWYALAIMTGHAFQNMITDDDVISLFRCVYKHLQPGGHFAFETRNPSASALVSSCSRTFYRRLPRSAEGAIICSIARDYDSSQAVLDYKVWRENTETGQERVSGGRLRFLTDDEIRGLLKRAGFQLQLVYGDWNRDSLTDYSPEMIYLCQKPYSDM